MNLMTTIADLSDIPPFLLRKPEMIYTYTQFTTFLNCSWQFNGRYVSRHVPYVSSEAQAWGNKVHSAFEHRIRARTPLPDDMRQYDKWAAVFDGRNAMVEHQMAINVEGRYCGYYDKTSCWFRGKADVTVVNGTTGYIGDWKTGKMREDPTELEMLAVLLRAKHPELTKIMGQYFWLRDSVAGPLHDLSATERTFGEMNRIVKLIEADMQSGVFKKEKGALCGWCDDRACEFNRKPAAPRPLEK